MYWRRPDRHGTWTSSSFCSGEYVKPKKGAELHKVVNGKDTVVAIFDGKHFVEVKGK